MGVCACACTGHYVTLIKTHDNWVYMCVCVCVCVCVSLTGHYVTLIKTHDNWVFFDDESVEGITESQVQTTFGSTQEYSNTNMDHGKDTHTHTHTE